jgi:glycosyltransferase involved in cell wall biosynthesis
VDRAVKAGCNVRHWRARRPQRLFSRFEFSWLDRHKPDLVVINMGTQMDGAQWMAECHRRGLPYVTLVHCAVENSWPGDELADRLAEGFEHAARTLFVSRRNMELVRLQFAIALPEAAVVRNPCRVSYTANPAWPDQANGMRLACVGRLEPGSKGQDILLDVLSLEKWRRRSLFLTFFGNGASEQNLRRRVAYCGLKNVAFGGFAANVESIWEGHHALVMPSRYEGLPLAIVEAMLCNRPCIVTDVSGNAELLDDNHTGFIAEAPTVKHLDEAMERAWQRRGDWQGMGREAGVQVRKRVPEDPVGVFVTQLLSVIRPEPLPMAGLADIAVS